MDSLIIQVLSGSASPFEEERLRRWREEAPENEDYFQEMSKVWALTKPEPAVVTSGPPSVDVILRAAGSTTAGMPFQPEVSSPDSESFQRRGRAAVAPGTSWVRWGLLAASVAAVALGVRIAGVGGPQPAATYQAAAGETNTFTLGDGSFIRLADGARLREWDVEGTREVSLEGRAFFAVARDENLPFVVRTRAGEIRVLGTRFQVEAEGRNTEALVIEGLVRVSNEGGSVDVSAGSRARMATNEEPKAERVDDVYGLLDWPGGTLVFQGTPLSQVVEEVSLHYGRPVSVVGPELANRQVTAWFQGDPFEAVTESLCMVTEALCTPENSGVTIRPASGGGEPR